MATLLQGTELTPEQKDYIETIKTSSEELLNILNDILGICDQDLCNAALIVFLRADFSKIETDKLDLECHPFSLRNCFESAMDIMSPRAFGKDLELLYWNKDGDNVLDWILGDSTRFRQIILNCKFPLLVIETVLLTLSL
jgi:signal transduction histidine kinase